MKKSFRHALLGISAPAAQRSLALASCISFEMPIGGRCLSVDDGLAQDGGGEGVAAAVQGAVAEGSGEVAQQQQATGQVAPQPDAQVANVEQSQQADTDQVAQADPAAGEQQAQADPAAGEQQA